VAISQPQTHDHFDLLTTHGLLRLYDPRRFGAVVFAESENSPIAQKLLGHLGVEPLAGEFDLNTFHANLKKRSTVIKQVLLAGDIVVGVGNIYASEALFLAGIRPTVRAHRISRLRAEKLRIAIIDVLARAVAKGGSTLRDFSNADGQTGYFQLEANVYDRAGEPCRQCGHLIKRLVQGQRATYFCSVCQKP
jgi:formamidopyrimidine-DNA glycosylase